MDEGEEKGSVKGWDFRVCGEEGRKGGMGGNFPGLWVHAAGEEGLKGTEKEGDGGRGKDGFFFLFFFCAAALSIPRSPGEEMRIPKTHSGFFWVVDVFRDPILSATARYLIDLITPEPLFQPPPNPPPSSIHRIRF